MPKVHAGNKHPKTEHLKATQWKPGQSGNPKGRPPRPSFLDVLAHELGEPEDLKAIVQKYLALCKKGDLKALIDLADRLDGKATQRTEYAASDGTEIVLRLPGELRPEKAETNGNGSGSGKRV